MCKCDVQVPICMTTLESVTGVYSANHNDPPTLIPVEVPIYVAALDSYFLLSVTGAVSSWHREEVNPNEVPP